MAPKRDDVVFVCAKCTAKVSIPRAIAEGMEVLPNHKCKHDPPSKPKRSLHPKGT